MGYVLTRGESEADSAELLEHFARGCAGFGKLTQPHNTARAFIIAKPVLKASAPGDALSSCAGCTNYVPANVVERELGFPFAVCAAKGSMVLDPRQEADGCFLAESGPKRSTADGLQLLPMYEGRMLTVKVSAPKVELRPSSIMTSVDPREWPTDAEVTADDLADGIKAWRRVDDPRGHKESIYMPIFDGQRICGFDPRTTYGEEKPWLYNDHQGLLYTFAAASLAGLDKDGRTLDYALGLEGHAGTGKTAFFAYVAYLMDLPFTRISITRETEVADLIGEGKLTVDTATGQTVTGFKWGRFILAYERPGVIVIDEPNLGTEAIWGYLRPAFDSAKQVVVEQANKIITKHPACFVGTASNPEYDPLYVGVNPVSAADRDRMLVQYVSYPSEQEERKIIRAYCDSQGYAIPDDSLDAIMAISNELREMSENRTISFPWGIRPQLKVASLSRLFDLDRCYGLALGDALDQMARDQFLSVVRSHVEVPEDDQ